VLLEYQLLRLLYTNKKRYSSITQIAPANPFIISFESLDGVGAGRSFAIAEHC